jgi:hypothetical protein
MFVTAVDPVAAQAILVAASVEVESAGVAEFAEHAGWDHIVVAEAADPVG